MNFVYKLVYPVLGAIILILIIYLGFTLLKENSEEDPIKTQDTPPAELIQNEQENEIVAAFTLDEIEEADNLETECLTIVNNNVYRIPESYANIHPGGYDQIADMCGIDASSAFNNVHGDSQNAISQLNDYLVGTVDMTESMSLEPTLQTFSISEVNEADDLSIRCLTVVDDKVYDIPESWANTHPGGYEQIASMCGIDASVIFNNQHGSLQTALDQLERYYVGELK